MSGTQEPSEQESFSLDSAFEAATSNAGLALGPLELQYEELFAEALEDGVITADERGRLERAAENMGLNTERLGRLEEAMTAAYETHHRIRVVDQTVTPATSLSPLVGAPPLGGASEGSAPPPSVANSSPSAEVLRLQTQNATLRAQVQALSEELERAQAAIHIEVDLGELDGAAASAQSPEDAWKAVLAAPGDADALRVLLGAYREQGERDGVFLVSQALVALGVGNEDEQELYQAHRQSTLISPQRAFDQNLWGDCLSHPEEDATVGAIFSVVAPAILIGRMTTLRRDGLLNHPPVESRLEVEKSTIMSVRAVAWAAALIGLPCPAVFLQPELERGYVHAVGVPPYTIIGKHAQSGCSLLDLAFLAGRHLTGYRGEHFVRTLFSATADLEDLFLAALLIANPQLPIKGAKRARIEPLARAIEPLLESAQLDALKGHYLRFAEEGGRANLMRWSSGVEKTSARAGLALCQDLPTAYSLLKSREGEMGPLCRDLMSYSTGPQFLALRKRLGISLGA